MNTRKVPGWENAPVPICKGGDPRALTFCCKPGYTLTFSDVCRRDAVLKELGVAPSEFVRIKDEFSKRNGWDDPRVCFGSLSYCCMRRSGCPFRDEVLLEIYPGKSYEGALEKYFKKKRELAELILRFAEEKRSRNCSLADGNE